MDHGIGVVSGAITCMPTDELCTTKDDHDTGRH